MADSFVLQYLRNLILPHRLSYLIFFVTSRCNAACNFCLRDRFPERQNLKEKIELTTEEIDRIASRIHGLPHILFSGGEPFMRSDLHHIVRSFYTQSHTRFVTIPTNGYFSEAIEDIVARILSTHRNLFLQIHISVNGIAEAHDSTKGLPLSFAHLLETSNRLKKLKKIYRNLRIASITVINDSLKGNLSEFTEFLEKDLSFFDNYYLTPIIQKDSLPIASALLSEDREAWARLKRKQERRVRNLQDIYAYSTLERSQYLIGRALKQGVAAVECAAVRKFVVLKENGEVFPCEFPKYGALGNIRDFQYDMKCLLDSVRARHIKNSIIEHGCYCFWLCAMNINLISRLTGCARILLDSVFRVFKSYCVYGVGK